MAARRDHGWWPYLAPYGCFLVLVELGSRLPEAAAGAMLAIKVLVPGGLFLHFLRRGAYPELRDYRPGPWGLLADTLCGLAIAALWVGPFLVFEALPRPGVDEAFDPDLLGADARQLTLGIRLLGFAAVTPFVEELFVRSFLIRVVDVIDTGRDFRRLPVARFSWRSFLLTVLWFTFSHASWEWGVAALSGVAFNLWLYRRGHLGATVVAHAVANASIWALVVLGPGALWIFL